MRDWIFWTLVGFAALQFMIIAAIQSVVIDIRGRLSILYDKIETLRNTPRN